MLAWIVRAVVTGALEFGRRRPAKLRVIVIGQRAFAADLPQYPEVNDAKHNLDRSQRNQYCEQ